MSLCVGINKFADSPQNNLNGCVNDARMMEQIFNHFSGTPSMLTDSYATKNNIIDILRIERDQSRIDKLHWVGFSFSSHGTTYPDLSEEDGLGEALVCADVRIGANGEWDPDTIITDKELNTLLWTFPKETTVEIFLDTCFSGGMDRMASASLQDRFLPAPGKSMAPQFPSSRITVGLPPWVVMWCASSEAQTSADAYIKSDWHGAFTYSWQKVYQGNPKERRVGLLIESRQWLARNFYEQLPRLKCWNKPAQNRVGK